MGKVTMLGLVSAILWLPAAAVAYEYDAEATGHLITEMVADLGGHAQIAANSGKKLRCSYRGTKRISIIRRSEETLYTGEYLNCQENGKIRDGVYEIHLSGDEIVSSGSVRSINGRLFDAARIGDTGTLRELIRSGADVNYSESIRDSEGREIGEWTPLMSAVMSGNIESVKLLINSGAWINYMNSLAVNAFWISANTGRTNIAQYLVKRGAYLNNSNYENVTPLMAAAMNGHLEMVKLLLGLKVRLDEVHKEGDSALMFALAGGHTAIARLLLEAGAKVDTSNRHGVTALHIAVAERNLEGVKLLLKWKADPMARTLKGLTVLDVAKSRGSVEMIRLLEGVGK